MAGPTDKTTGRASVGRTGDLTCSVRERSAHGPKRTVNDAWQLGDGDHV